jgi:hypothetical protein
VPAARSLYLSFVLVSATGSVFGCGQENGTTPATGGSPAATGGTIPATGGTNSGGIATGGVPSTSGGTPSGGQSTGGTPLGGANSGGKPTGGSSSGGANSGGKATGGNACTTAGITKDNDALLTYSGLTIVSYGGYLNGESFQQDGIVSYNGYQYAAFWNTNRNVVMARRALPNGGW